MDAELKKALLEMLEGLEPKSTAASLWTKISSIANSPFVLTVVGGLFLASVSAMITQCNSQNTRQRELAVERLRAKQAFVQSFSSKFERYLELTLSLRKREIFLKNWQKSDRRPTIHYGDGRNFDQTRATWEQEKRYWLDQSTDSPTGLINAGRILFTSASVRADLDKLEDATTRYGSASNDRDLYKGYADALDSLDKASIEMARNVYED
ncbi:MAG: hypothetical protein ACREIF_18945 [Chthoniobacterales bacterium]